MSEAKCNELDQAAGSPFTICAECKWFEAESNIWHGQYCGNPRRAKKEVIDFVTGKRTFGIFNYNSITQGARKKKTMQKQTNKPEIGYDKQRWKTR